MKWFRSNIKHGSRLALFALAIQFVLSFGHFHGVSAQAAPAVDAALDDARFAAWVRLYARADGYGQQTAYDVDGTVRLDGDV